MCGAYPRQCNRLGLELRLTPGRVFVNEGEEAAVMLLVPPVVTVARIPTPRLHMLHRHSSATHRPHYRYGSSGMLMFLHLVFGICFLLHLLLHLYRRKTTQKDPIA